MGKPFDCPTCGDIHPRGCKDHVRRCLNCETSTAFGLPACVKCGSTDINEKSPCRKPAKDGIGKCITHGINPTIAKAVARREEEALATKILGKRGVEPLKHPVEELLDLTATLKTLSNILSEKLDEATDLSSAEFSAWERSLERFAKILVDLSRLGLEGRKVALDEVRQQEAATAVHNALVPWIEGLKALVPPEYHQALDAHLAGLMPSLKAHLKGQVPKEGR